MRAIPREVNDAFVRDATHAYALGLWCADGYWWSSSIGITNVEPELVIRFAAYLAQVLSRDRFRLRIYWVAGSEIDPRLTALTDRISICPAAKMKRTAYHFYVNSRPLLRSFLYLRNHLDEVPHEFLGAYFAGRFDGDGSFGETPRIAYTTQEEARTDAVLLNRAGVTHISVLHYARANEYCIYIRKTDWGRFRELLRNHSWKEASLHPVETVMAPLPRGEPLNL